MLYDQPLLIQGNEIAPNERIEKSVSNFEEREKWAKLTNIEEVKLLIKPWNDSTVLLRVHNLNDKENKTVTLFASDVSPLLTTFYGNTIRFSSI